jgi:hypothetical protein
LLLLTLSSILWLVVKPALKWILGGAVAAFAGMQLANPSRINPPLVPGHDLGATNAPPPEIATLLRNACYDCHSRETRWPWYSGVAPVSWWVATHVRDGRERLDFSSWPHDDPERARKKMNRIREEVEYGNMPLPSYTWGHPEARLTAPQREQLIRWAEQEAERLKALSPEPNRD